MIVDPKQLAFGIKSSEFLKEAINQMYRLNSKMQKEHSMNINSHLANYVLEYENVMMNNKTCDILTSEKLVSTKDCIEYADGSIM